MTTTGSPVDLNKIPTGRHPISMPIPIPTCQSTGKIIPAPLPAAVLY